MTTYRKGERLRVTLDVTVLDCPDTGSIMRLHVSGTAPEAWVWVETANATIERVTDPRLAVFGREMAIIKPGETNDEFYQRILDAIDAMNSRPDRRRPKTQTVPCQFGSTQETPA